MKYGVICDASTLEMRYAYTTDLWATWTLFGPSLGTHITDLYVVFNLFETGRGDFPTTKGAVVTDEAGPPVL